MKKQRLITALVATVTVIGISGCSGASVEQLLSPPRLDGEQAEIYEALRSCTSDGIKLKYPKSGKYRSAIVVSDIDGEPTDEAIAFYESPNVFEGSSLRINFLDMKDGEWVSVYDFAAVGNEVEKILFENLGNDETSIIITYSIQNSSDMAASVMSYKDASPSEVYSGRYSYMNIFDTNSDGTNELFIISTDRSSGVSTALSYGYENNRFTAFGTAALSAGAVSYRNAFSGNRDKSGQKAIFIDYALSDGGQGTEVLITQGKQLLNAPAVTPETVIRRTNSFTPDVSASDIDGDGIVEIPVTVPFIGYENLTRPEQVNMAVWYTVEAGGRSLTEKFRSYISIRGDYMAVIPEKWHDKVTAAINLPDNTVIFYYRTPAQDTNGEELLKITALSEGMPPTDGEKYISLGKSEATGYSFYAELNTTSTLSLSEKELRELFRIL